MYKRKCVKRAMCELFAVIALIVAIGLCGATFDSGTFAEANSALRRFEGVDSSGVVIKTEDCPVVIDSEELVFDLNDVSEASYDYGMDVCKIGTVKTKYVFRNPADYTAEVNLVYPFGFRPYTTYDENGEIQTDVTAEQYSVTADGVDVARTVRHTYKERYGTFDYVADSEYLSDDYVTDTFYSPGLVVYKYVYRAESQTGKAVRFNISGEFVGRTMGNASSYEATSDGGYKIGCWLEDYSSDDTDAEKIEIYFIGADYAGFADSAEFYENMEYKTAVTGTLTLESREEMTFKDLALTYREDDVSEIDWYNAVVSKLNYYYPSDAKSLYTYSLDISYELLRWYDYSLSIPSGETLVNEITAPVYPDVNYEYKPAIYTVNYFLSPAKTWASFGSLDIKINTSNYVLYCSLQDDLTRGESGYEMHFDSLPDGELAFTVCASEDPEPDEATKILITILLIILGVFGAFLVIAVVVIIVCVVKRKKRKAHSSNGNPDQPLEARSVTTDDVFGKSKKDKEK